MVVLWRRYEDFISGSRPSGLRAMVPFRRTDCSGGRTHHALYSMTRFSHDLELAKWSGVKSDVPERVPLESTRHLCGRHRHWTCLLQRDPLQPRSSGAARTGSDHPEPLSWVLRIGPCKDEGLKEWAWEKHGRCSTNLRINRAGNLPEIVQIRCVAYQCRSPPSSKHPWTWCRVYAMACC